ncbi:hypothetical protein [Candidatus Hecatella orcuttiae]|uniref:hypothetical protein n=1 Tax=Candidatus Hecatella orcuttiae TaxID=1935119 RepID=UPI00286822AF|nr:hypothetical protein [Candidatus Hecatella orcuttiae]
MSEPAVSPTVFHFLEKHVGKRVVIILDRDFGYEGKIEAVSHIPPGIWLAEAEAVVLRSTMVNPIPRVVSREKKSELFIHLNSVQRVEVLSTGKSRD